MKKISPSILDVPKDNLINYVTQLTKWGVNNVHYDIMDNIFVPNVALQYAEVKSIKENCPKHIMDIHLMVKDVFGYYEMYKNVGDIITFHYEALTESEILQLIEIAKKDNVKLGISIKPKTKVREIIPLIKNFSLVLIMSVEPGFGGQKFIENSLNKVSELKQYLTKNNLKNILIQIDGGINGDNIKNCFKFGVDMAVVGSYLVKNFSEETINKLTER
ncbi:ribulose-phosphate 3-epimerase [Metamycoplasma equirhinis]|uniref:ribulose-phosphate 3-epimerase n=1 Tax=Metamycoplasma equirhinis TaxID=92402 RepID=UPI0035943358